MTLWLVKIVLLCVMVILCSVQTGTDGTISKGPMGDIGRDGQRVFLDPTEGFALPVYSDAIPNISRPLVALYPTANPYNS